MEVEAYSPGTFCWIDLATPSSVGSKNFYAGMFGWRAHEIPVGPGVFTMLQLGGKAVASLYQLSQQHQAQGVPAHWMAYIAVANVDETAGRIISLGGRLLVEPFDVLDLGRMALVQDSTGAPLALWQAGRHIGARVAKRPGTLAWTELITNDTAKAGQFYTQLFGWNIQAHKEYTRFSKVGQKIAGMKQLAPEGAAKWPQWRVYLAVADCDASAQKAKTVGGKIVIPPASNSGIGRVAVLQDPHGALFAIVQPTH